MELLKKEECTTPALLAEFERRFAAYTVEVKASICDAVAVMVQEAMRRHGIRPHVIGMALGIDIGQGELYVCTEDLGNELVEEVAAELRAIAANGNTG